MPKVKSSAKNPITAGQKGAAVAATICSSAKAPKTPPLPPPPPPEESVDEKHQASGNSGVSFTDIHFIKVIFSKASSSSSSSPRKQSKPAFVPSFVEVNEEKSKSGKEEQKSTPILAVKGVKNNSTNKKLSREELLSKLQSVEEAIAKKKFIFPFLLILNYYLGY